MRYWLSGQNIHNNTHTHNMPESSALQEAAAAPKEDPPAATKPSSETFKAPALKEINLIYAASDKDSLLNYKQSMEHASAIWKRDLTRFWCSSFANCTTTSQQSCEKSFSRSWNALPSQTEFRCICH